MPSRLAIAALVMGAALGAPVTSAAQLAGAGTGTVVGTVTDDTGRVMRNVDVSITGRTPTPPRKTTSMADGEYHFAQLSPGDYVLTFASPGFANRRREVHVGLGSTLTLDVALSVAEQREEVAVKGVMDRHSATVSQSFDLGKLTSWPGSRSFGGLISVTHAVTVSVFEIGGGTGILTGVYGAYGRNNTGRHTIEGIVVTGLFAAGFTPDYGSIEEASILTAASSAEWPTAGIHTDFATKSGSNQYRGTVYGAAEHRGWQSSNVDADQILRGALAGGGLQPGQANQLWRNFDINADVGGFVRKNQLWWYASVRRQEVAARLVNFPAAPSSTELTNYSGKATYRVSPAHRLVLYGQRGLNHQPYRLDPFAPAGSDLSAVTAINDSIDSTIDQHYTSWLWKAEWNAIVADSMVFEVRAGQFAWERNWMPRSTKPRFEDIETLEVRGGNRDWQNSARRNQVNGNLSYVRQDRTGRHSLRFGGEAVRFLSRDTFAAGYPDNVVHVLRSGRPSSVYLFDTPSLSEAGVWTWSAYASDAWRPNSRLTFTLGLRFDRHRLFLPEQWHPAARPGALYFGAVSNLIDWNMVAPRFAAVYDLKDDGGTLLKFAYGRYGEAPNATLAFNSNPNSNQWWTQYQWTDPNESGVFEPGEEGRYQRSRGGLAAESMDPDLRLPVLDEAGAWIERTLPGAVTLRTGAVWRLERFPSARHNRNQLFEDFTVPVPILDRGPDGLAGTSDDGPTFTAYDLSSSSVPQLANNQVRNVPGASSEYLTWEVAATRQTRGRWSFGAGFAHTWNGDHASNYAGQSVRNNPYPLTPNDLINTRVGADGRYEFTTWTAKAHGTFEGPWQIRVTPVLRHQSGQPFGRTQTTDPGQLRYGTVTILMEPINSRRLDNITLLDLRIEKMVLVKGGHVSAFLDVFNCLNANPEQNTIWSSGTSFMRPVTIVPPRIARVGLTFDW